MQYRQKIKSWMEHRVWVNPYWTKLAEHPNRIFLEQDLSVDKQGLIEALASYQAVICEFGSGSGQHLVELARRNPQSAILGFELRFKRAVKTIEKAKRAGLDNVFVICGYAQNVNLFFSVNSIDEVYINFPDPWEKNKKHRMLNHSFLIELSLLLKQSGRINFKTDHSEYFESSKQVIENLREQYALLFSTDDLHRDSQDIILTEFENLFLSQGLKISALICEKKI